MLKNLFKKKESALKENEIRVVIPEEEYGILEWKEEGLPCIGVLNSALKNFEPKKIFSWHLSLIIDYKELVDNGMPSQEERDIVDPFCDQLDEEIKAGGNALFLVRETWNGTRRMVWRVYDPEIANQHLQYLLEHYKYPREFDYHMEQDMEWEQAKWYFEQIKT
ncbi:MULTISPECIES: DUF695 domain-containing protein [Vibrio]|uniref:DUF695 domain-containing protein n=1 Tax=Vibrio tasmaniensis 1F-267 TaxID=1191324 RepID=A0ABX3BBF9_9VIBR|nr:MULTISPECIES: DUF695 domain-containing protein [Vibrio]OEF54795.1 DUF695 domain-containing protein [Vibrio tasmaniensis 1F-267]OEF70958.1 DUF695 domain-containing protein [Vibrio tasmaniensis 1F-155]PMM03798.1 DUF695 domain-containing protein [Vibrio splendidus]PMN24883.1 DUF695 domain-containing protein [Vibrio splendidus]